MILAHLIFEIKPLATLLYPLFTHPMLMPIKKCADGHDILGMQLLDLLGRGLVDLRHLDGLP